MAEKEEKTNDAALNPSDSNTKEAQALTEMKTRLEKLESENADLKKAKSKYYDQVLNGGTVSDKNVHLRSSAEIRKEMAETASTNTNLRNAELSVELDDAVIRETGESSYLPKGHDISPTVDERELAERFPKVLKQCIEESEGDPDVFNLKWAQHLKK